MLKRYLTDWYEADQKPARSGVYMIDQHDGLPAYAFFNGKKWYFGGSSVESAAIAYAPAYRSEMNARYRWRGVNDDFAISKGWLDAVQSQGIEKAQDLA